MKKKNIFIIYAVLSFIFTSCINDFQEITVYPYKIGDFYSEGGAMGIVYKVSDDGANGMIVSLSEAECAWGDTILTLANDTLDAINNINKIKQIDQWKQKFPAFYWCDNKNKDGVSGWCLPSKHDWEEILENRFIIDETLVDIGAQSILGKTYWSSTEYSKYEAYHVDFILAEMQFYAVKLNRKKVFVRAVRAF
ncbi:MAG: DUF1566 domain-containing protein [Bacteroidales bacterium]|nr:DUF1566 domain-containing protein [Bacteroidales bacterium]